MLTQLQKTAVIIALAICFAAAVGGELWDASQYTQPPKYSQQSTQHNDENNRACSKDESNKTFWEKTRCDPISFFTLCLMISTTVLAASTIGLWIVTWRSGIRQSKDMQASIKLARDEFRASHNPALRLKHIWLATDNGVDFFGRIETGRRIVARLDVVNIGSATAIIRIINFVTRIVPLGERLPQRPPYNDGETAGRIELPNFPLNPGITFTHPVSDNRILTTEQVRAIRNGEVRLYLVGTIEYWAVPDQLIATPPRLRGTAFCRYLKFHSRPAHPEDNGRFEKDEDPDYEYQD